MHLMISALLEYRSLFLLFAPQKLVTKEAAVLTGTEAPVGDGDDADDHPSGQAVPGASSDVEEGGEKKKKQPNMNRLLKARLEKLVNLTDKKYVLGIFVIEYITNGRLVVALGRQNSWNYQTGRNGRCTTRLSKNPSAWRTSSCVLKRIVIHLVTHTYLLSEKDQAERVQCTGGLRQRCRAGIFQCAGVQPRT